ncbi:MAG: zf-HC2 domain-containing protein [Candidatus Omnitrophica bacterium]|nr:zf-HC2 domain-containing protein [Candidatus Omnitrophota bacterium]
MDHTAIHAQLFAFYDGELTGASRRAVEDHLLDCAECRALIAQWKHVTGALFQSPTVSPSDVFVQRVMRRIMTPRPRAFRLSHWLLQGGWLIPTAGLAVMLFVMIRGPLQQTVSIESLLLSDGHESSVLQQVLTGDGSSDDDVLGLLMEDAL